MDVVAGAAIAFVVAALTTPVGVSGAFLLVPVQLSVLGVPAGQVAPTNLLFNVIAIPGALVRYFRQGSIDWRLARLLTAGSLPGVVIGAVLRVHVFTSEGAFLLIVAAVLAPLGVWLAFGGAPRPRADGSVAPRVVIIAIAFATGIVGGLYGIGGGSIIAPLLVSLGAGVIAVAPAALVATFSTSIAGVVSFLVLARSNAGFDPEWGLGAALGAGGLLGAYVGARYQSFVHEGVLRRFLGVLAMTLAVRYAIQAIG